MANTYTIRTLASMSAGKSLLSIYNASGSGRVIRIYRCWALNSQSAAVTGILTTLELRRITNTTGGVDITFVAHDSNNESPNTTYLLAKSGSTDTLTDFFRRINWSTDEPAVGTAGIDEMETIPNWNEIWNSGYQDSNMEPIVLREGYGVTIRHAGSSTVGQVELAMELTIAAT